MQRVLSADPANQPLSYWVLNFARFPGAVPGKPDPRIAVAKAACDRLAAETPELLKAHPFLHDQPEEDCLLIGANYDHFQNSGMVSEERFCAYVRSCPRDSAATRTHLQSARAVDPQEPGAHRLPAGSGGHLPQCHDRPVSPGCGHGVRLPVSFAVPVGADDDRKARSAPDRARSAPGLGNGMGQEPGGSCGTSPGQQIHRHRLRGDQGRCHLGGGTHLCSVRAPLYRCPRMRSSGGKRNTGKTASAGSSTSWKTMA